MINKKLDNVVIEHATEKCLTSLIENRFDTIKMMSEGYYHSIFNNLSVIFGQIELIREEKLTELENNSNRTQLQLDKIEKASETINQILEPLFRINTLGKKGYEEEVPLKWLCEKLPLYLSGYIQYLREKKNIKLFIETEISKENHNVILTKHIIDYVIPIILKLLNDSICSGVFVVRVLEESTQNIIEILAPEKMLSNVQQNILITDIINQYQNNYFDNTEIDEIMLECTCAEEFYKIRVMLPINKLSSMDIR